VIHDFVLRLRENPRELVVLGDGMQSKPYVYVEDCLDGMEFGFNSASETVNCYNLAVDDQTSVTEIAEWTIEAMASIARRSRSSTQAARADGAAMCPR